MKVQTWIDNLQHEGRTGMSAGRIYLLNSLEKLVNKGAEVNEEALQVLNESLKDAENNFTYQSAEAHIRHYAFALATYINSCRKSENDRTD